MSYLKLFAKLGLTKENAPNLYKETKEGETFSLTDEEIAGITGKVKSTFFDMANSDQQFKQPIFKAGYSRGAATALGGLGIEIPKDLTDVSAMSSFVKSHYESEMQKLKGITPEQQAKALEEAKTEWKTNAEGDMQAKIQQAIEAEQTRFKQQLTEYKQGAQVNQALTSFYTSPSVKAAGNLAFSIGGAQATLKQRGVIPKYEGEILQTFTKADGTAIFNAKGEELKTVPAILGHVLEGTYQPREEEKPAGQYNRSGANGGNGAGGGNAVTLASAHAHLK